MVVFLLFVISFNTLAQEQILYCTELEVAGFEPNENYRYQKYNEDRFTLKIDFQRKTLISQNIGFTSNETNCGINSKHNYLSCHSDWSRASIKIFQDNLKFVRTQIYGTTDSVYISHGKCERF